MLSTPGVIQQGLSFSFISSSPGQFLVKNIALPATSFWTAGEAADAGHR